MDSEGPPRRGWGPSDLRLGLGCRARAGGAGLTWLAIPSDCERRTQNAHQSKFSRLNSCFPSSPIISYTPPNLVLQERNPKTERCLFQRTIGLYSTRPAISSLLWAAWLCMPQSVRLKAYRTLEKYSTSDLNGCAVELPFGLYAKRGPRATANEALATHHVSLHTTVPVPTVLDVISNKSSGTYFLMTRLSGQEIAEMPRTLSDYTDEEMDVFVATVGGWLQQLRALGPSPHGDAVCGFIGGPFYSYRIKHDEPIGPFASQDEFHAQWYNTLPEQADPGLRAVAARLRNDKRYRMYFTHGDISPNNILVDNNYKPVGLIDFGCAGWMPEYWEFTYAIYRRQRYRGWVKAFTQIFPQYEDELAVEMEQWKYISPW